MLNNSATSAILRQIVRKLDCKPPEVLLKPIPAIQEPFSLDCVGPLPKTKTEDQYSLTILYSLTHFPEVVPLQNIGASSIVKVLIRFFTYVRLPKSVQSNQGSNFMSGLFPSKVSTWHPTV